MSRVYSAEAFRAAAEITRASRANGAHTCSACVHICIRMHTYHMPVCPAQHTVRACACARHTTPAPTLCTQKGECKLRCTAESERDARRADSRSADHAGHARCAAPDRPILHPLRPFGLVWGCSLAFALTSWGLQAPACCRLKKNRANRRRMMLRYADPTQCALSFFCRPWVTCRQFARAAVPLCSVSRRAPIRGNPIACAALARRRLAQRPEISSKVQRRSPRPTAPCYNPRAMLRV